MLNKPRYEKSGIAIPSVTEIIPKPKFWITPEQLELAKQEGTDHHELVKMYWDNKCDTFGNEYLIRFDKFIKDYKKIWGKLLVYEQPLYAGADFGGTPDMIFENAIVDLKRTSGVLKNHALQLAGYYLLAKKNKIGDYKKYKKTWFIMWNNDEKFRCRNVFNANAESIFLTMLQNYRNNIAIEAYFKN